MPSERELISGLGVGRSTIREAMVGLAVLGVLEIRHLEGTLMCGDDGAAGIPRGIAPALSRGITRGPFEARGLVEVHVVRLAADRRTDADVVGIAECLADHAAALRTGQPAVDLSGPFHVRIGQAAHSEVLCSLVRPFAHVMTERGPVLEAIDRYRNWEVDQHRSVFEPLREGDPDLAAERKAAHVGAVVPYHEQFGLSSVV